MKSHSMNRPAGLISFDLKSVARTVIPVLRSIGIGRLTKGVNVLVRKLSYWTHGAQYVLEFGADPKCEWYDHFIDVHHGWVKSGVPTAWERGIFNLLALKPGGRLLELCCGDGFNAASFYAAKAATITSIDYNCDAIAHARDHHASAGITFLQGDVRTDIPDEPFDNVIWDSAICLFTPAEVDTAMTMIKTRLGPDGIVSGHIGFEPDHTELNVSRYESIEDLEVRLSPFFRNVKIFSTSYGSRFNLYFYASDGALPFDRDWPDAKILTRTNPPHGDDGARQTAEPTR